MISGYYNIREIAIVAMRPIPLTLLTGFLGSGKTSLVNALLKEPRFAGTAVLINELGEVSIDHDLVAEIDGDLVSTTTGCLCCSATSDVKQALFDLWARRKAREIPPFYRVVIETTGLVDPAPVVANLIGPSTVNLIDRNITTQYALAHVVSLIDVLHGETTLDRHFEALKQLALADLIVFTKSDLASDPVSQADIERLRSKALELNPSARVFDRHADWQAIVDRLLNPTTYDLRTLGEDAIAWLAAEQVLSHEHADGSKPDPNRHAGGITSHVIVIDEPVQPMAFYLFLEALKLSAGTNLLRMKGMFKLADDPGRPVIAHGVQHQIHKIDKLPAWPSTDRRTRIVLIGCNLNVEAMRAVLTPRSAKSRTPGPPKGRPAASIR